MRSPLHKMLIVLEVLLLFLLGTQFKIDGNIYEFEEYELLGNLDKFKSNGTNIFITITGYPCNECDTILNTISRVSYEFMDDVDNPVVFIHINQTKDPTSANLVNIKPQSIPESYMQFRFNNYILKLYSGSMHFHELSNTIKSFLYTVDKNIVLFPDFPAYDHRRKSIFETIVLGLFKGSSSKLFEELNKEAKLFKEIKFFYTFNTRDFSVYLKKNFTDSVIIIKNPYLYEEETEFEEILDNQTIHQFILEKYLIPADICTQALFNIFAELRATFAIYFSSPRYSKDEILNLTDDLGDIANSYPQLKFCISLNGFDSPSVMQFDVKKAGEMVIITPLGKIYKGENLSSNAKLLQNKVGAFIKKFLTGKAKEFHLEQETKEFLIEKGMKFIETPKQFLEIESEGEKYLALLFAKGKVKPSILEEFNGFYKDLGNLTRNVTVAVVDTSAFKLKEEYIASGDHNNIVFKMPKDVNIVYPFRGQRIHKSMRTGFLKFIEDYKEEKLKRSKSASPIGQDL